MIIDNYIDITKKRDHTYYVGKGYGFIRQPPAFYPECRAELYAAAKRAEPRTFDGGVYFCTEGPRPETNTEIRMCGMWGADVVGMTIIPEVYLARELEMCYASLTYISHFAEGSSNLGQASGGIFSGILPAIFKDAILALLGRHDCTCSHSTDVCKNRGDIGEDWHTWITES